MTAFLRGARVGRLRAPAEPLAGNKAWRVQAPSILLLLAASQAIFLAGRAAAEPARVRSPISPQESLQHFIVADGLKVELAAHEPNVIDPVAIRFDEVGRMWVVEMRDYPTGLPEGTPSSRISVLEDEDNDGFFEKATVFADGLKFATGLQPWRGGVFVTMAGRISYMKDSTGDGKADVIQAWYTGFAEQNTQLRASHPTLALDNHIYVANGLRGGMIVDAQEPGGKPISISGMDFRFDPLTRKFEAVSGMGQFGLAFDDYGNRFVCTNRNPAIHVVLEDRYLKKNPLVAVAAVTHDVAKAGDESRVFPITRAWTTSHLHAGQFTAACGLEIYRGDALPSEFRGNIFVCEPTGHLVHREIMESHGVTFKSRPAYDGAEFLASRDEWFSPVNLEMGPDGALYVVDMYRAVIEHPEWMPEELRKRPDQLWGNDRGRIYRIVPTDFQHPTQPQLSDVPSAQLIEYLAHPNAWWRETAARLILERQNKPLAPQLQQVALHHESPLARIHAIHLLHAFDSLPEQLRRRILKDRNPRVVEQAIAVTQPRDGKASPTSREVYNDPRVRFMSLLNGGIIPDGAPHSPADKWELEAFLIAAGSEGGTLLAAVLQHEALLDANVSEPKVFVGRLARLAARSSENSQHAIAVDALLASDKYSRGGLAGFLQQWRQQGRRVEALRRRLSSDSRLSFDRFIEWARQAAGDTDRPEGVRIEAVDLIAAADHPKITLAPLALADPNPVIRAHIIRALPPGSGLATWEQLLAGYPHETPALQNAILDGALASNPRSSLLLDAISGGRIQPAALGATRIYQLLNHGDDKIRRRANNIFAAAIPADREQALASYQQVLTMGADARRGRTVFQKQCATCHRIAGIGTDVAPDISDSRERSPEQLLTDIIQPNRAIDSNYFGYTAVTEDGRVYTGILTSESSTSLTLKEAEGRTVMLQRSDISELYSNGVSFMPDGLEKLITPQEMADLIAFIKNWRYLDESAATAVVTSGDP